MPAIILLGCDVLKSLEYVSAHWVPFGYKAVIFPQLTFQLVESTDLWKLHDLYNTEKEVLDEICLVPEGMDSALCVKRQQFSMHCDALEEDIKLVKYFIAEYVSILTTSGIPLTSIYTALRTL